MAFPKQLSARDHEWIKWILPVDRPGYRQYHDMLQSMVVIGEGRRGNGEMILGHEGNEVDFSAPLAPVFAYGAIETNFGTISITIREMMDNQVSVEIVSHRSEEVPAEFEEARRWTYSTWKPGEVCPQCCSSVREVSMHTVTGKQEYFVLAVCGKDKRLWVYDETTQVNHLIPMTNFYNELMLHKNIRDPKIALDAKRLFTELSLFSDRDLVYAFLTYNKLKMKVHLAGNVETEMKENTGVFRKLKEVFLKNNHG
jgi:hypothetical protein